MILYKVVFGAIPKRKRQEAESAMYLYLSVLAHNGQACCGYIDTVQGGELCAYVVLQGPGALQTKNRSEYEPDRLKQVVEVFGQAPKWVVAQDDPPKRDTTWARAPFLFLFTYGSCEESPLCRGDNGNPVPLHRLPGPHDDREQIHFWKHAYQAHDQIWLQGDKLEIPAYRELACPGSQLSLKGREICRRMEAATGLPTYYFLMRHWGRREGDEDRPCPGCGGQWRRTTPASQAEAPWPAVFQCAKCRLVSQVANSRNDERHASIGEWTPAKKRRPAPKRVS